MLWVKNKQKIHSVCAYIVQKDTWLNLAQTSCCQTLKADLAGLSQDNMQAALCVLSRVNKTRCLPYLSVIVTLSHTVMRPAEDTLSNLHAVLWQANKACHENDIDSMEPGPGPTSFPVCHLCTNLLRSTSIKLQLCPCLLGVCSLSGPELCQVRPCI